jgi:hypothetical protein
MRIRQLAAALFLGVLISGWISTLAPQVVHAQCGLPGGLPCPPRKKPTATEPRPTRTPTSTPSPTLVFVLQSTGQGGTLIPLGTPDSTATAWLTYEACYNRAVQTMNALTPPVKNEGNPPAWEGTVDALTLKCWQTAQPTWTPILIQPVAGPVFLRPGVKNALILVMIIGVLFTGGVLIAHAGKKITK